MKIYAPDYYSQFKCIANNCRHSCCVGWEIEIDEDTLCKYKTVPGDFGKRLSESITTSGGTPVFLLGDNERCPFLNKNNLCDIILNIGEENLCQICTDHPRFRNFYTDRTEIGIGLTCEAAAILILNREAKTELIPISETETTSQLTKEERDFFEIRTKLFEIAQNRNKTFKTRIQKLLSVSGITLPQLTAVQWSKELLSLEQLYEEWTDFLKHISNSSTKHACDINDIQKEQLLVYFIFRHTAPGSIVDGLRFALLATDIIMKLAPYSQNFPDLCRMFSSEIEYSENNTDYLMNY